MAKHSIETRGSTLFTELSYDDKTRTLTVDMINYGRYSYRDFTFKMWQEFKKASSYGHFYNEYVKGIYQFTRLR
jgi:hypothetical protein